MSDPGLRLSSCARMMSAVGTTVALQDFKGPLDARNFPERV